MATFDEIDVALGLELVPCQYDLEHDSVLNTVPGIESIRLDGSEAALFLDLASCPGWRPIWEMDMQSVSEDAEGRALISTWVDLLFFRRSFCGSKNGAAETALLAQIKNLVKPWREHGVEVVELVCVRDQAKHDALRDKAMTEQAEIDLFFKGDYIVFKGPRRHEP